MIQSYWGYHRDPVFQTKLLKYFQLVFSFSTVWSWEHEF